MEHSIRTPTPGPHPTWHSLMRSERPGRGFNLLVDRLGDPNQSDAVGAEGWRAGLDPLRKRLEADRLAVAPGRRCWPSPFEQTLSAYSARGIEQMSILMMNDAGLPLGGTGFDRPKPEQLLNALTRITARTQTVPGVSRLELVVQLVGLQEPRCPGGKDAEEKKAYIAAEKLARETGSWNPVLDRVSGYRLGYAVDAQASVQPATQGTRPRPCDGCGQSVPQCRLVPARSA